MANKILLLQSAKAEFKAINNLIDLSSLHFSDENKILLQDLASRHGIPDFLINVFLEDPERLTTILNLFDFIPESKVFNISKAIDELSPSMITYNIFL